MNSYIEYFEKAQEQFLNSLKQAQELNVNTLESFASLIAQAPAFDVTDATKLTMPTPSEFMDRTFAFTNEMLETRKEYMTKLAELAAETQKQFADAAKRMADAAKN